MQLNLRTNSDDRFTSSSRTEIDNIGILYWHSLAFLSKKRVFQLQLGGRRRAAGYRNHDAD
jgi:hypothetical protein